MAHMKDIATEYGLGPDEPDEVYETVLETEAAVRTWQRYLQDSGRVWQ